jgi:histone-lysine N-methyltransferase SETMAR
MSVCIIIYLPETLAHSWWQDKLPQGVLFLQDNASLRTAALTHWKLAELHFEVLKHPAYSPDLAPSGYHLLPNVKYHLKGTKISTTEDAIPAADDWFAAQP